MGIQPTSLINQPFGWTCNSILYYKLSLYHYACHFNNMYVKKSSHICIKNSSNVKHWSIQLIKRRRSKCLLIIKTRIYNKKIILLNWIKQSSISLIANYVYANGCHLFNCRTYSKICAQIQSKNRPHFALWIRDILQIRKTVKICAKIRLMRKYLGTKSNFSGKSVQILD